MTAAEGASGDAAAGAVGGKIDGWGEVAPSWCMSDVAFGGKIELVDGESVGAGDGVAAAADADAEVRIRLFGQTFECRVQSQVVEMYLR